MPKSPNLIKVRENGLDWLFNVHWDWCERVETKGVPKWYANELIEVLMTKVEAEAEGPRSSKILGSDESQLGFRTRRGKEERSAARARALEKLKGYLDKPCRMDWTDVPSIAAQVALRVREPKLIFQGKSDTCAPNMILINLAKRSPEKYVGLVMDLVTTGKSRLENLELQMPGPVINGAEECQRCGMPAADYAVLGSIGRPSVLPILGCFSPMDTDRFYKGTEPEQIVELLVKLGYTSITKYNAQNWKLDPRFEDPGEYKRCLTALADATLSANRFV